jgi:organic radical activating enzyme
MSDSKIKPHFVITGGEPLLPKWQLAYIELLEDLNYIFKITDFTFETNGTQKLIPEFKRFLRDCRGEINVSFSISPKLSNSGHKSIETLKPEAVMEYALLGSSSWFKYVVSKPEDIHEIEFFNRAYNTNLPVYLMPQGGTRDEYLQNEPMVYSLCAKHGYRFSPRLQVTAANNGIGI